MKKVIYTLLITTVLFMSIMAVFAVAVNAAAVTVSVVADESWGNATYDSTTNELCNVDGGYSFTLTRNLSAHTATVSKFGTGISVTKVVIPYQITVDGIAYTVTAQGVQMLANSGTTNTTVTDLIVSEGISTVSTTAFRDALVLKTVRLPSTLKTLSANSFLGCLLLENINIPEGVTMIGGQALSYCKALVSVTLPSTVTNFNTTNSSGVFASSIKLQNVIINFPLTSIPASMFKGCTALTSFNIPDTVTGIIGNQSFAATGITQVVLPAGVTSIDASAFNGDKSLKTVTFKGNITNIGATAFSGDTALQSMTFEGKTAPTTFGATPFSSITQAFTVYYPADGTGYGVGSVFRSVFPSTTIFTAVSPPTSCTIDSITSTGSGYTVEYRIVLGLDESNQQITNSKNMVALYNGNDLVAVESVDSNATSVYFTTDSVITKARIFVWNDFLSLKPLCAFQERLTS